MSKLLVVIDMQNDFITGSLGSEEAQGITSKVKAKIEEYKKNKNIVIFTRDTHDDDYLNKQEGMYLPVIHCVKGTKGHEISSELDVVDCEIIDKTSFGSLELANYIEKIRNIEEIELCGLCTDICVVSNALILKAKLPEVKITVDESCCAGVTEESHKAAITTMKMCQVNIIKS